MSDSTAIELGTESAKSLFDPPAPREGPPQVTTPPLVLAIGDSWFNYWPRGDILDVLEDALRFDVQRNAQAGRSLAEMLYVAGKKAQDGDVLEGPAVTWLVDRLKKLSAVDHQRLRAILISAGGNDVAGDPKQLKAMVLGESGSGNPLNEAEVAAFVDGTLRARFVSLLACINRACDLAKVDRVPILLHGYSYPVPDGRGVLGTSWLMAPLIELGYKSPDRRIEVMRLLIDRLNKMQKRLVEDNRAEFANVVHVDVREALLNDASYRVYWQNELHPTIPVGFGKVAKLFIDALTAAPARQAAEPVRDATPSTSIRMPPRPRQAKRSPVSHSPGRA
jgi:lysophospholipase L1-like esterase